MEQHKAVNVDKCQNQYSNSIIILLKHKISKRIQFFIFKFCILNVTKKKKEKTERMCTNQNLLYLCLVFVFMVGQIS